MLDTTPQKTSISSVLELTKALISRVSITPDDDGCQKLIAARLAQYNFQNEHLRFGNVENLWSRHGEKNPLIVFAGHTDVVPPGPLTAWKSDPFHPTVREGHLYGRGAADMKSGLAAMIVAAENFVHQYPNHPGSIAFLITSDEEGTSVDGTQQVVAELKKRKEKIDYCIVGEASSEKTLGDQVRVGRRGSLHGKLIVKGIQSHIAYPRPGANPIHTLAPALVALTTEIWDKGNEFFPPTILQFSNIHGGTGALNVVPGELTLNFNFRYSTVVTVKELQQRVTNILKAHKLDFDLQWNASAKPFLTAQGKLLSAAQEAIKEITRKPPKFSTGGGTSDARFIAAAGAEVIEIGPINTTVHKANEKVLIKDLASLTAIYEEILKKLLL